MTEFTPYTALIGGAILGFASIMLLLLIGKTAGISGIFADTFSRFPIRISWQLFFVLGIICGPIVAAFFGFHLPSSIDLSWSQIIVGGLLVGFGVNYGSGCTSGHGICGMGRFSKRSIIATLIFMGFGVATVFIMRHVIGG
ncbi:YeeE/YedE thiosulfate transporter family protein [Thalassotalea ponticola]|uniref:YeeE/YedE family protein n=1 Tax=Thalassotalea ponticola TaxID=1523392 RepID=UPI0025B50070|nr:YeeE/YedE thiosulfate transporter family protein [Thalassotalea ponticola]MDN3653276.1 YeeE/YedE thiosulfate transporter family protein [Thalassotalea ponticola]